MPSAQQLIRTIQANLARMHVYEQWKIGLTDNPERLEARLNYPGFWRYWKADSTADAREVVQFFVQRGMKQQPDDGRDPTYVYLY